ncbi:SWIM zinc finger family protein [Methylococcus sp. ANG]|uniref:SWIM zinc finger family protein n=1 Tax=Methylococcus sp. ANG TaxID=3231903 RepID=UPI00345A1CCC
MRAIRTWWGQRFIAALERFTDAARLARGRSYAGSDRIKSWQLKKGEVSARIRGNANPSYGIYQEPTYDTALSLSPIRDSDWALLVRHLGSRAAFVSRLLLNEMPENIEKPFELLDLHLLPHSAKDFKTRCSCPDYQNPCKHIAGLCYLLSAQLDQDPFLLFELRGLPRASLFEQLRHTPLGKVLAQARDAEREEGLRVVDAYFTRPQPAPPPGTCAPGAFWDAPKRLPELPETPATTTVPALLIRKGGDFPEFWNLSLPFPAAMEMIYDAVRKREKEW